MHQPQATTSDSNALLGVHFGPYEIVSRLGVGGMAEVWLANTKGVCGFERRVVIKTMLPNHASDPELVQMFVREAMLAGQLEHPGIIQIFDLGIHEGTYYIAMEHVVGCSLRQIRKRARESGRHLPIALCLETIADCCESLEYAHQLTDGDGRPMGLIHRDISPDNIMVTFTGHTKVLDFGVATARDHSRTRVGTIKGKYPYMAPEVLRGAPDSALRDIYSIGVILYELLTDSRPFTGRNDAEIIYKILHEPAVPPRALNPLISQRLEQIILRAMAPRAADRYSEAGELAEDLRRILRAEVGELRRPELGAFVSLLFPERDDVPSAIRRLVPAAERHAHAQGGQRLSELELEVYTEDFEEVFSESTHAEPKEASEREDVDLASSPEEVSAALEALAGLRQEHSRVEAPPARSLSAIWRPRVDFAVERSRSQEGSTPDIFPPGTSAEKRKSETLYRSARADSRDWWTKARDIAQGRQRTSLGREEVEAARHFDHGLQLLRSRDYEGARSEWEIAAKMAPENKVYEVNLRRLIALME